MKRRIEAKYDVAVLIPHYNNLLGLANSIRSISYFGTVLILIVDDGSFSEQRPLKGNLSQHTEHDIEILNLDINFGIEKALNTGLKYLKDNELTDLVARLDCGDRMKENRLLTQVNFLNNNQDIYLLGSWVDFVEHGKLLYTLKLPATHNEIKMKMNYKVCFIHPAVTFRLRAINSIGYYPMEYPAAEDYAYFMNFTNNFKTANVKEVLTVVEKSIEGISLSKRKLQLKSRLKIIIKNFHLNLYSLAGVCKIILLMILPYAIIMAIKKRIYK
jgi:glycosyltransferase involved in cell wall biosynthesis